MMPEAAAIRPEKRTWLDLRHGDCLEGMKTLGAESVDLVVTSPPYNLGIGYRSYDDTCSREEYLAWCVQWLGEIRRVLKPDGSFFLNVAGSGTNPMFPWEILGVAAKVFVLQNTFHWIKSITVRDKQLGEISVGHFKPINSKRFVNDCHEFIFHLTHSGEVSLDRLALGVVYADKSNIARWGHTGGRDRRCRGNNWFIPYETIRSRKCERPHPATFPVALAENCFLLHGHGAETVMMDPFLGLGASAVAAQNLGAKRFIGFEIDDLYLAEAKARLNPEPSLFT
ncbi:MAG TPA: site-specific DNA-methyltransferase [Chthoniobacterales bacterium]